jgi:4,5-dihydroxyphthalate decarboxylase
MFGDDIYPYGIDANRTTLEALVQYAVEQGVAQRHLAIEDLFAPTAREPLRL